MTTVKVRNSNHAKQGGSLKNVWNWIEQPSTGLTHPESGQETE